MRAQPSRRIQPSLVVLLFVFASASAHTENEKLGGRVTALVRDTAADRAARTVVFIGRLDDTGRARFHGTGSLLSVDGIYHLLTARHVVEPATDDEERGGAAGDDIHAFVNGTDGAIKHLNLYALLRERAVRWITGEGNHDFALIPFPKKPEFDARVIPVESFVPHASIDHLVEIYWISYQPGTHRPSRIAPVFRAGIVSRVDPDGTLLIDGPAFPGNSGSPVFLRPPETEQFVGIVTSFHTVTSLATSESDRLALVYREHSGLSTVVSGDAIKAAIASEPFQRQLDAIRSELATKQSP